MNVYIFVRGGVVQGVRASERNINVHVIDYDNIRADQSDADFELAACGRSFLEIEADTVGVL